MKQIGVYVGRLSPMHLGHQKTINKLIKKFGENSLLVLGSTNAMFGPRHLFSFEERKDFVQIIFPGLQIEGLPDFGDDETWLIALDQIIEKFAGESDYVVTFFGGCSMDVDFFLNDGRNVEICDRDNGEYAGLSATKVRENLAKNQSIAGLVDDRLIDIITDSFALKQKSSGDL